MTTTSAPKMKFIVDVQGFRNTPIAKEVAIQQIEPDRQIQTFLIKPPYDWKFLPARFDSTNAQPYVLWHVGEIPYEQLKTLLEVKLRDASFVFVRGSTKTKWLSDMVNISGSIVDVTLMGCPSFDSMKTFSCRFNELHKPAHRCATENVQLLDAWFKNTYGAIPSPYKSATLYVHAPSFSSMDREDIAHIPKETILDQYLCIEKAWNKLSCEFQNDSDISCLRPCHLHNTIDPNDISPPLIKNCQLCNSIHRLDE